MINFPNFTRGILYGFARKLKNVRDGTNLVNHSE